MMSAVERNRAALEKFYSSFKSHQYGPMVESYAKDAVFSDCNFPHLPAPKCGAMWHMLIENGSKSDMPSKITYEIKDVDETSGHVHWEAIYKFRGKNLTHNKVEAHITFNDSGLIVKHHDEYNFYGWAKQALGVPGMLMGWTGLFQGMVQKKAMATLDDWIAKRHPEYNDQAATQSEPAPAE